VRACGTGSGQSRGVPEEVDGVTLRVEEGRRVGWSGSFAGGGRVEVETRAEGRRGLARGPPACFPGAALHTHPAQRKRRAGVRSGARISAAYTVVQKGFRLMRANASCSAPCVRSCRRFSHGLHTSHRDGAPCRRTLSVSTSARTSPDFSESPGCFPHFAILPVAIVGDSAGISSSFTAKERLPTPDIIDATRREAEEAREEDAIIKKEEDSFWIAEHLSPPHFQKVHPRCTRDRRGLMCGPG
jgi:hypothetical protein